jgi:hypothetical protein
MWPIQNADGDGTYRVEWTAVGSLTQYELQEATQWNFNDSRSMYLSPYQTHQDFIGQPTGVVYYYRVRGWRGSLAGQWSNVESVAVGPFKAHLPLLAKLYPPLVNGDFETGSFSPGWTADGVLGYAIVSAAQRPEGVHGGRYAALLGNPTWDCRNVPVADARVEQTIHVPTIGGPTLRFWYRLISQDKTTSQTLDRYDVFEVKINGNLVLQDANMSRQYGCDTSPTDLGWKERAFSLSAYRGVQVTVSFSVVNRPNNRYNTWVYVDDVTVQ